MWMWSSMKPRTRPLGLVPLNGVPVALTSISGNSAQPLVATVVKRAAEPAGTCARRPAAPTPSALPFVSAVKVNPLATCCTVQSALGPGVAVDATVLSGPTAGMVASGP
jgi:hypothetical protein